MNQILKLKLLMISAVNSAELSEVKRIDYDPALNDGVVMKPTWMLAFDVMSEEGVLGITVEISTDKMIELELHEHPYVIDQWIGIASIQEGI